MSSQSSTLNVTAVRENDAFRAPIDYILETFARTAGFNLTIVDPPQLSSLATEPDLLLVYANRTRVAELYGSIRGVDCPVMAVERGPFFGSTYLVSPDLPADSTTLMAAADDAGFQQHIQRPRPGLAVITLDLFAATFWFLTRYEEYISSSPDAHGRFLSAHSAAQPAMYDRPLGNHWCERLRGLALELTGRANAPDQRPGNRATVALTHDVDLLAKYSGLRGVRRALSSLTRSGEATTEIRNASLVLAGLRRDPYDSFDDLFTLKERLGVPSTFFLMGGGEHSLDGDYQLDDPKIRRILSRSRAANDEIGVHPSYESYLSADMIRTQAEAVSKAVGKPIHGSRQHYLRFSTPETLRAAAEAGLEYDSSLSFADRAGFRCGWSGCFQPFDVEKNVVLPIVEIPLIAMDITLAVYEKLESRIALERISNLMEASQVPGGAFVFLWHNTMRDRQAYPGYWDTMEFIFFAAAGSARFATLQTLMNEYKQTAPPSPRQG